MMLAEPMAVGELCILLLQEGTIDQDQLGDVYRSRGRVNRAAKAVADQPWQVAAMVEVPVGEDDGIDRICRHGKRLPIEQPQFFPALEEAAIDEDARTVMVEQMLGAGNGPRATKAFQAYHRNRSGEAMQAVTRVSAAWEVRLSDPAAPLLPAHPSRAAR